jgi:hypothetical protein
MKFQRLAFCVLTLLLVLSAFPLMAQDKEPGEALISIYKIAPGKHLDFLKWMAAREAVAKEAGAAPTVWYAHTNGADWDYVAIGPVNSSEQDKKIDELSAKKGLTTGFKASLEFRQFVSAHSDTFTVGPTSASDLVASAAK